MSEEQQDIDDRSRERSPFRNDDRDRSRSPRPRSYYRGSERRSRGSRDGNGYRFRERAPRDFPHVYENSVFVGNLPYRTNWRDLKDCFRDAGEIVRADVLTNRGGMSKGMGTVEFATRELAQKAIQMFDRTNFMGREIFVREDLPPPEERGGRTRPRAGRDFERRRAPLPAVDGFEVYVGNLPYSTSNEEFKDIFKDTGDVKSAEVKMDRRGKSKGYGIVIYGNVEDSKRTIEAFDGQTVEGRRIQVRAGRSPQTGSEAAAAQSEQGQGFNQPPSQSQLPREPKNTPFVAGVLGNGPASDTLFVSNLPWETTQSDLFDLFGSIAAVKKAEIQFDNTNRPSGNAVVQFSDEDGAASALSQLDRYEYGNRELHVSYVTRPQPTSDAVPESEDAEMNDETTEPQIPSGPQGSSAPATDPVPASAPAPVDAAPSAVPDSAVQQPEEHIEE